MYGQMVEIKGHILDSLLLSKILDLIEAGGCRYQVVKLEVGEKHNEPSHALLRLSCPTKEGLVRLVGTLKEHGVTELGVALPLSA